jgi:A/G-specific adenine glycosylase
MAGVTDPALLEDARARVLDWFGRAGRELPWRATRDPYRVLVAEVLAQQTQAARAAEAWPRFLERFPDVAALAGATPAEVLRAWQGLGYNRRAVNLQRAACVVVERHGGRVPADLASLEALPGVGPYTARAVAALAFGAAVGPVDTNVRRVLGRVVAGEVGVLDRATLQRIADDAVPAGLAGPWTHALMDIGATLCRPRRPDCEPCPARRWCRYAMSPPGVVAAETADRRTADAPPPPFRSTSRWLRGRIVERLRDTPDGEWVVIAGPIGTHDSAAVEVALDALMRDGLLERDAGQDEDGATTKRVRLPR